jgi:hypothetical protein
MSRAMGRENLLRLRAPLLRSALALWALVLLAPSGFT